MINSDPRDNDAICPSYATFCCCGHVYLYGVYVPIIRFKVLVSLFNLTIIDKFSVYSSLLLKKNFS